MPHLPEDYRGTHAERRAHPRVRSALAIRFRADDVDAITSEYLGGVAANCSFGGIFLETDQLMPKGTIVKLEIQLDDDPPVQARAVVRRVQRWRKPHGMGVEFVEVEGIGNEPLSDWLGRFLNAQG
ncbi:MAG: PilZ domain-containing protein [Gammaproteobacteria bacterium]